jgi:class 3 adenylate cyclase
MKHIVFVVGAVVVLCIHNALGQDAILDSLKNALEQTEEDTVRVNVLNAISDNLYRTKPSDAIVYGNLARNLATQLDYDHGLAYALKNLGLANYFKGDYVEVLDNWLRSLEIFENLDDTVGVANLTNNIGAVYFTQGDDPMALDYYLRSLRAAERIGNKLRIATALVNIGTVYLNKKDTYSKALEYFLRALPVSEELGDQEAIATTAVNLGELYLEQGNTSSALFYFDKALEAYRATGGKYVSYALVNKGKVYMVRGEYDAAIQYQREAYNIASQNNARLEMVQALLGLSETHRAVNDLNNSIEVLKEAEGLAKDIASNSELKNVYEGLSLTYARQHQYRNAYTYHTLFTGIKDTLYNLENDKRIEGLQFRFEIDRKQDQINLLEKNAEIEKLNVERQKAISTAAIITGILLLLLAGGLFNRYKYIRTTKRIIEEEKNRSDNLLLNILPEETAEELKRNGETKARKYDQVTILFTDFKGFTELSARLTPEQLVKEIHECYMVFDEIMTKYQIEKIKTIGDAYMAAGGLPVPNRTHAVDVVHAALEIREYMLKLQNERQKAGKPFFEIRIGIHSGPVVAGVVGSKKFAYDIWGDTVNIAARMESNSAPGRINISEVTHQLLEGRFACTPRGKISVKGGGERAMFFVDCASEEHMDFVMQQKV